MVELPDDPTAAAERLRAAGIAADEALLCVHASAVFQPPVLRQLAQASCAPGSAVVAIRPAGSGQGEPFPLACATLGSLPALWNALVTADTAALNRLRETGDVSECVTAEFVALVRTPSEARAIEKALLQALENPRDGRIDRLFNRKLSRPLSRVFLHLPLTPNHITILSFIVALMGVLGFAQGTYLAAIAGALLFQCAAVLDCCDGEVARVKFMESRLGDVLDITLDSIANAGIFVGMARGAWVTGRLAYAQGLGLAAALGILGSFVVVTYAERFLPEDSPVPEHRVVQGLVSSMTSRDFSVLVFLASVANVLPWFLWGAAFGANIFWLLLLVLLIRGRSRGCPRV